MDLTTATPVEIDTELARLYDEQFKIAQRQQMLISDIERIAHEAQGKDRYAAKEHYSPEYIDRICNDGSVQSWDRDSIRRLDEQILKTKAQIADLRAEAAPLHAEYRRRPWTRAYLVVTSGQGHVHSSMECSTCNKMGKATYFSWMVDWSGATEAQIVADAGERACTICYPSVKDETLNLPTKMFSAEEKTRAQAREEREAKRAAKEEAKVVVEGMEGWTNEGQGRHVYPTVRGATNAIAGLLGSLCWYGPSHPSAYQWANNVKVIRRALEAKGAEYDYDKALAAARKKAIRDGGQTKY